jgi:hypothetical protein
MSKWADFGISAVRFNSAHTHIDRVRINPDNGESTGAAQDCGRADVVACYFSVRWWAVGDLD